MPSRRSTSCNSGRRRTSSPRRRRSRPKAAASGRPASRRSPGGRGSPPRNSRNSASVTSRVPIANDRLIVRSWGDSSPPAYGSDPGTVPIRNETGPRTMANVWPDGLMNQPRSAGIAGRAGRDRWRRGRRRRPIAAAGPSRSRRGCRRPGPSRTRRAKSALSSPRSRRRDGLRRKPPRQTIRARRVPGISLRSQALDQRGVGSMPYSGRRWMTSVRRLGSSRWTSMGQTSSGRDSSNSAGASRPWTLGQSEVALRRRLDHAAGSPRGPGPDPRARAGGGGPPGTGPGPRRPASRPGPRAGRTGPAARRIPAAARTPGPRLALDRPA